MFNLKQKRENRRGGRMIKHLSKAMIKITILDQKDNSQICSMTNENISTITQALNMDGYEYNLRNGYWERGDQYVLLQEVQE